MTSRQSVLLCDRCGARYTLASLPKGGRFRCRNCGKAFQIELDEPEPATRELRRAAVKAGLEPLTGPLTGSVPGPAADAPPPPLSTDTQAGAPRTGARSAWALDLTEDERARDDAGAPRAESSPPAPAADDGDGDGAGDVALEDELGADDASADELLFGRYSIDGELGRGEMGVVYRAVERTTGRKVALKTLLPGVALGREGTLRFGREARAIERLRPAGLVPLLDHGESYETRYLVSELAEGTTLDRADAALYAGPKVAARLAVKLARILDEVHRQGVLHLDLKPSNVILDASGAPRILDVGLTRAVHTPEEHGYQSPTDEVGGRTLYRAPEQIRDDRGAVDARADVWSLGAVLYELLTGVPAFSGGTRRDTVREVLDEDPKPPSAIDADIPAALDVIVAKALEKRAADRYASAAALADDLERFLAGKPIEARPPSGVRRVTRALRRHRRGVAAGIAAAFAVAGLAGGAWWWLRDPLVSVREELASPRPEVRGAALERGLGLMEVGRLDATSRVAMIDLAIAALGDRSDAVRRVALERLIRHPGAIPDDGSARRKQLEQGLAGCLARQRTTEVREAGFRATEVFQAREVTPALVELARDADTPEPIAEHAIRVLGAVARDDVIVDLMHLVGRGGTFRTRAMQAISRVVERSSASAAGAAPAPSPAAGPGGAIDRGRNARATGPDRVVANVLAAVQAPAGEDPILYGLRAGNTDTKLRVIWVLDRTRDARTTTLLPGLFSDDDPVVSRAAAAVLVEFGGPVVERKLQEAMASDSSRIRANAAFALGELAHPDALDALVKALFREPDAGARAEIARALGRLGQRSAMPHLIRALDDGDPRVRAAAHTALTAIAKEDAGETSTAWQEWWDTH